MKVELENQSVKPQISSLVSMRSPKQYAYIFTCIYMHLSIHNYINLYTSICLLFKKLAYHFNAKVIHYLYITLLAVRNQARKHLQEGCML